MNRTIPKILSAKAYDDCKLWVCFEDGVEGEIDLSDLRGKGVFKYWNKKENFKTFQINDMNKLSWNEDLDMDPDAFYLQLINKDFLEYAGN